MLNSLISWIKGMACSNNASTWSTFVPCYWLIGASASNKSRGIAWIDPSWPIENRIECNSSLDRAPIIKGAAGAIKICIGRLYRVSGPWTNHWLILGRTDYIFSNLSCEQVKSMALVIGLHGNVCCPNNTGQVTFMSNLSCCLVKFFVHSTHCTGGVWNSNVVVHFLSTVSLLGSVTSK